MAKSSELFEALLETLRPMVPAGVSHDLCVSVIREQLSDENALATAQQIIDNERANLKLMDSPESDLWDAVVESLCETFQSADAGAVSSDGNTARTSFVARLKAIVDEANRRWLIAVPVNVDLQADAVSALSTVNTQRVVIAACETQEQLDAQLENACRVIGVPAPVRGSLTLPFPTQSLFVAVTQGAPEPAYQRECAASMLGAMGYVSSSTCMIHRKNLGPANAGDVYEPVLDAWLIEVAGREVKRKTFGKLTSHSEQSNWSETLRSSSSMMRARGSWKCTLKMHPLDCRKA